MTLKRKKKGQTSMEYVMLFIIIAGACLAAQNYIKRGLQGRWKSVVDDFGDQYDPRTADTSLRQTIESNTNTVIISLNTDGGYWTRRQDDTVSTERKTGYTSVGGY